MNAKIATGAELVLLNGRIVTLDPKKPIVSALAISGGRVLATGDAQDMRELIHDGTRSIDLQGRTAVPGLIDGHAHMDREGLKASLPSLSGARCIDDILERIRKVAATKKPGEWIVTMPIGEPPDFRGVPECLAEKRLPTRHELDRAAPDNPVYIKAIWGYWRHTLPLVSIANSRALELAGVTARSMPPTPSVQIERDFSTGEPTGIFLEWTYMPLVEFTLMAAAPNFSVGERTAALERSMAAYNALGTTSVFEGHGVASDVLAAYQAVRCQGRQSVRSTLVFSPAWSKVEGHAAAEVFASWGKWLSGRGYGDEWLRLMGVYAEIGESEELRIRARKLPQTGWAGFHYDASLPREAVKELLLECARSGVTVVGIWPEMLDLFTEVDREVSIADQRWVLGHVSLLDAGRIARIADLGLNVTTHTNRYIYKEGAQLLQRVGKARENEIVPLRSLLNKGIRVSLATDNVPPSLFPPIWQVIARKSRDGPRIAPDQALTREEALACASRDGAYLSFEEADKGTLEPGKLADLAVLTADPLGCPEDEIAAIRAHTTIVGGRIVHDAGE